MINTVKGGSIEGENTVKNKHPEWCERHAKIRDAKLSIITIGNSKTTIIGNSKTTNKPKEMEEGNGGQDKEKRMTYAEIVTGKAKEEAKTKGERSRVDAVGPVRDQARSSGTATIKETMGDKSRFIRASNQDEIRKGDEGTKNEIMEKKMGKGRALGGGTATIEHSFVNETMGDKSVSTRALHQDEIRKGDEGKEKKTMEKKTSKGSAIRGGGEQNRGTQMGTEQRKKKETWERDMKGKSNGSEVVKGARAEEEGNLVHVERQEETESKREDNDKCTDSTAMKLTAAEKGRIKICRTNG